MKDIDYYPKHSNKTLMSWTKKRLVEEIEILLHNWDAQCVKAENISNYAKQLQEKLDKNENDNWISVDDRLPNNCEIIIFCTKYKEVYIGFYNEKMNHFAQNWAIYYVDEILCWQPLPEPPKEK